MVALNLKIAIVSLLGFSAPCAESFVAPQPRRQPRPTAPSAAAGATALHLNIPRVPLPDAVGGVLDGLDLKNPNDLDTDEYNAYAGAAIGGTLAFFLLPGAVASGAPDVIGEFFLTLVKDFAISAPIGGGLAIYLALRKDDLGGTVRGYGTTLLDTVEGSLDRLMK
jgi:hypothetical protein